MLAVRMPTFGKTVSPAERWSAAVRQVYPTTPIGQKKSGPRNAFVGLCEAGLVKGIEPGVAEPGTSSAMRNKTYAVQAIDLLREGTHTTVTQLWSAVSDGEAGEHASQMDVVLALWKNGLIVE